MKGEEAGQAENRIIQPMSRVTAWMAVGTTLSRATGFARVFALAYALGALRLADTYNLANTTPNIVYDLIVGGVLSATLIPVFVDRLTTRRRREAWEGISAVVTLVGAVLVVVTLAFVLLAPLVVHLYLVGNPKVSATQVSLAVDFLRLFAPQVAFYGLIALATALLNTQRRFIAPMFAPIVNNLVVICVLLAVAFTAGASTHHLTFEQVAHDHAVLLALGLGTTAGVALQALALLPSLSLSGLRLRFVWIPRHDAVRSVVRLSSWTFGFVVANQIAFFVMLALSAHQVGGVSAWTYGYTFFQLPYGIVAVSVMSAIQPSMAERWAEGDGQGFCRQLASGLRSILAVIIPSAFGYIVLSRSIVTLVIGHGATTSADTHLVAQVMTMFALGLPGFCAYQLLMRAYQAMQNTRAAFFHYLLVTTTNVSGGFALYFAIGVRGLALSLSIAYTLGALVALAHLHREGIDLSGLAVGRSLVRSLGLSLLMAAVVAVVAASIGGDTGVALLVRVATAVAAGVSVFVGAAGLAADVGQRRERSRGTPP